MASPTIEPSAIVLHELRAPLGLMVSAARAAAEECGDGTPARRHVEVIERTALRLLASAQQILYATAAEWDAANEPFDPFRVARDWILDSKALGQRIAPTFTGRASWMTRRGNAGQFVAILQSLLSNALDHGSPAHPIEICLQGDDSCVSLSVTNVLGQRRHRGMGLGTAVCTRLAGSLGAELIADPHDNEYTVRLVLTRQAAGPLTNQLREELLA